MKVVFYISGHGYGHAVRDIEIIKSLLSIQPNAEIHFRTKAPRWLFGPLLGDAVKYHERELDFGVVQKTSFSADKKATFNRYLDLIRMRDILIEQEIDFLETIQPDVILSDITPLAFDAAEAFGTKAIAIGNFSWDWIYSDFVSDIAEFKNVIHNIQNSYKKAEQLWRIPFYGDMGIFPNIENVPLVGRKATKPADVTRQQLGLKNDQTKYVLLGLRLADLENVDWQQVENMFGITFVAVSRDIMLTNCLHLTEKDVPFENVLNACDAVLSKPGYSIVSEVLVNRTPMIYIPRRDFLEDPILIDALNNMAIAEELSQDDFYAGNWRASFDRLFARDKRWADIRVDGANVIAQKIVDRLS